METSYTITFTQGEVTFAGAQALYMNESYELSVTRCCMLIFFKPSLHFSFFSIIFRNGVQCPL